MGNSNRHLCRISSIGRVEYTRNYALLSTLVKQGYRVSSISPGSLAGSTQESEIRHYAVPAPSENFWHENRISTTLRAIRQRLIIIRHVAHLLEEVQPDIILCSEPDAWTLAVHIRKKRRCRIIVDLQEFYEDRVLSLPRFVRPLARLVMRCWLRHLARNSDLIIHVSSERQAEYAYLCEPGIVVGNYPNLSDFPDIKPIWTQTTAPSGNIVFLHAGALRPSYASDQLIEAIDIAALRDSRVRLLVLGGIAGNLINRNLIQRLIESGTIEIKEQVPHRDVRQHMLACHVGVSLVLPIDTAHRLAAPQKLYEYFAAGLPVLVADVPTLRRVITEHECGILVDPYSPESIADGLLRMVQDPARLLQMADRGRRAFVQDYNWERQETLLCGAVNYALGRPRP